MSSPANSVLIKYWGYSSFREKQEEIINSALDGNDTLALLPTGGGKSICFQVPALLKEGICLVISPLIALMQDQVTNLKKKGIKAIAIHSAMSKKEIDIALDNAAYGDFKFLYVSPERLETELFKARLLKMNVNLIAVDEAHCISQWGYDFRPSYLKIAELRSKLENIPVLALTATATPDVVKDIQKRLNFPRFNVIQKSFERSNLSYVVQKTEGIFQKLLAILKGVPGSGIIYVNSRKKTKDISRFLQAENISADYYHAGLSFTERKNKQESWLNNRSRIMVSTNAFGMGIDKPNVRLVVHLDLPDSLEAYFQEAGRAGRDEKKAYAVLVLSPSMVSELKDKTEQNFPDISVIKKTYECLSNYFQIPLNGGENQSYEFDIKQFSAQYKFNVFEVYNSIHFLEREGYISISENFATPSRINITVSKEDLYKFQVANKKYDPFIKMLLRTYGGLFENYIKISESELSKNFNLPRNYVVETLQRLQTLEILNYEVQSHLPKITYLLPRLSQNSLLISRQIYHERKKIAFNKAEAVISYAQNKEVCRSQFLLNYFGEEKSYRCGVCDICIDRNKLDLSKVEFDQLQAKVLSLLEDNKLSINVVIEKTGNKYKEKTMEIIDFMIDHGQISSDGVFLRKVEQ